MTIYLDYNATAPMRPEVSALMHELVREPLNASSVHSHGRRAKSLVENARRTIAEHIGAFANEIIFTGSGTEANNWALKAFVDMPVFVSAIEHPSILKSFYGHSRVGRNPNDYQIKADQNGVISLEDLESKLDSRLRGNDKFLVSVMLANNETGVIQPVAEIAKLVHAKGGLLHCDAVQAFGKIPVDYTALGCDLMTLSAHKMGGPIGAAALVVRNNLSITPMLTGGGQELNRRAGTENVAAIAGFAKASELIDFSQMSGLRTSLDAMEAELQALSKEVIVFGKSVRRLPNTTCITMPGVNNETQLIAFDLAGIAVSAGSACSSGRVEASHVLLAMGVHKDVATTSIRISGGFATSSHELNAFADAWKKQYARAGN